MRPGADPGQGKSRLRGPFFLKKIRQTGRLQQNTKYIAMI